MLAKTNIKKLKNLKYANINAKLKGMYSRFLSKEELEKLSKQNNLKAAVYFIKNELDVLNSIDENVDRRYLEKELDKTLIEDICKIKEILNSKDREIFDICISKYEIKCIIEAYKMVQNNIGSEDIEKNIFLWTDKVFKNIKGIEKSKDIEQFIKTLKRSKFFNTVNNYIQSKNENKADLETNLNKVYLKNLYNKAPKVSKKAQELIGENIDLLNISWIYRMKKYYNLSEEKVMENLIDVNYKIDKNQIKKLINSSNDEEFKENIKSTKYAKILGKEPLNLLELTINKYIYKKCKNEFSKAEYNLNTVFCYMRLKEYQKQNLINILGGISYNLDQKVITEKIIT